jgi:YVTN family beta-propeller protein
MTGRVRVCFRPAAVALALAMAYSGVPAYTQSGAPPALPNMGQDLTPNGPNGPASAQFMPLYPGPPLAATWEASQAVSSLVSPDHQTLLVLTSGYNRYFTSDIQPPPTTQPWDAPLSNEYVFVYDISTATPVQKQVVQLPVTYNGIVFDPSGSAFYVGGCSADAIFVVSWNAETGSWPAAPSGVLTLGHKLGNGLNLAPNGVIAINQQVGVYPCAAGVAISNDGQTLVAANYYNDSITIFTGGLGHWSKGIELDLRPGKSNAWQAGVPGGEDPFWVVIKGNGLGATAYVSSIRDREIDVVNLGGWSPGSISLASWAPSVIARIPVTGQPNKMTLNAAQTLLYVAEDQSDTVAVIDTNSNTILESIPVVAPLLPSSLALSQSYYKGANPNSVTLSADETQLYVTDGNLNCVSVVALSGKNSGDQVAGLIPTGWYPTSVNLSGDGNTVYVINAKSPTGANDSFCYGGYGPVGWPTCMASNQYNPQLIKAGLQSFPVPNTAQLKTLTAQVAINDRFATTESASDAAVMAAVSQGVQHVIFILKENRTYDQVLGDLPVGNGQPALTEFPQPVTPNLHNLAQTFVTLDNFLCTAEVSFDGWLWSTAAQAPDVVERQWPVAYAYRGLSIESEGLNRNVNVGIPTLAGRIAANPYTSSDPDVLPGTTDTDAPDGPENEVNTGYLWDAALRANLTVRNYGFFIDDTLYQTNPESIPVDPTPFANKRVVAYPTNVALTPFTDPYFRGFDNALPDYYRYQEWEREFDTNYAKGGLPSLTLVRFMHDHTGNFTTAISGVNTPYLMVADNDYAVGLLIQKIADSPVYASNTLIFVVEDDAQDGGDHMDSHRSIAFVAGAYVKQNAVVSTPYNTIDFVRTMEEVLGLPQKLAALGFPMYLNLNDALARPMADIFNTAPGQWSFTAKPSACLYGPGVTLLPAPQPAGLTPCPTAWHTAPYWVQVTAGMDFTDADRVDGAEYNRILWKGLMGDKPYPAAPTGIDLRRNREEILARYRQSLKQETAPPPGTN